MSSNKKPNDEEESDVESTASDTDSFVHVGSASGASSDSDWERVSFNNSDSDGSGDEVDEAIFDMDEIDLTQQNNNNNDIYNFTTSPPYAVPSPATQIPTTTTNISQNPTVTTTDKPYNTTTTAQPPYTQVQDASNNPYSAPTNVAPYTSNEWGDEVDEEAMLAEAIFLSLQESEKAKSTSNASATPNTSTNSAGSAIPTYPSYQSHTSTKASYLDVNVSPDAFLEDIGVPLNDLIVLQNHFITRVRQLAELSPTALNTIAQRCPNVVVSHAIAVEMMQKHAANNKAHGATVPAFPKPTSFASTTRMSTIPSTIPAPTSTNNNNNNNNKNNNNNNNNKVTASKPDYFMHERLEISPEDPLEAIGTPLPDVVTLNSYMILTVRHLAALTPNTIAQIKTKCPNIESLKELATEVVNSHGEKRQQQQPKQQTAPSVAVPATGVAAPASIEFEEPVWGYHYLAESVYEQIKADRLVKSAYVLFQEYMECPLHLRSHHPWKRVYHAYLSDAAKWNGARGKHKVENLTDTDVYAFLVWRSADSFAKLDVTAGPRAIYFAWTQMPIDTWRTAVEIDKVLGEDLRNPTICDRYAKVIRLNLTELCKKQRGVLHRVQLKGGALDTNHWLPTTLDEARDIQVSTDLWSAFEAGNSFFGCVPHGCVVMPNGSIPWECVDIMESVNAANADN